MNAEIPRRGKSKKTGQDFSTSALAAVLKITESEPVKG